MSVFKKYRRTNVAEMRPVTITDMRSHALNKERLLVMGEDGPVEVSISEADGNAGSPKEGDMIARNPKNHNDQWLVAADYFLENFEETE